MSELVSLPKFLDGQSDLLLSDLGSENLPAMIIVRIDEHRWKFMSNVPHNQHVEFLEEGLGEVADRLRSGDCELSKSVVPLKQ